MAEPVTSGPRQSERVHAYVLMSQMACVVDAEDRSTVAEPRAAALRIGDDRLAVVVCGDLAALERLVGDASRQLARLREAGNAPP